MNKMHAKVAVITRTKDRSTFLERACRSVASQTYDNYIHVIVNDGGDREAVEAVIASLSDTQKQKTAVFHRDISSGAPDTIFTESVDRVESDYFAIHDDDDTWHAEFLRRTVDHLDTNEHLGAVVVRADKVIEEVDGTSISPKKTSRWMPDIKVINLYRQCIDNQFTPIATLFRRSAYIEVGKFDGTLPVVGDWEFGVRLLMKYDADFIDPGFSLANYHHRKFKEGAQGNTSFSGNDKHRYYTNLIMNRYLREELRDGRLGVGYMMSSIKYNQSYISSLAKKVLPLGIVEKLKRKVGN